MLKRSHSEIYYRNAAFLFIWIAAIFCLCVGCASAFMTTPTISKLAPQGPKLIPHTDAWRRAQSDARLREKKIRRAGANIMAQTVEAARARVHDVDAGALPQAGARALLKNARRAFSKEANRFLPRATRRELARSVKVAS